MCSVIDNPTSREIRAVIRFLHAKKWVLWESIMHNARPFMGIK
jgi:hypothetical protein